jgi:hypothetical protein
VTLWKRSGGHVDVISQSRDGSAAWAITRAETPIGCKPHNRHMCCARVADKSCATPMLAAYRISKAERSRRAERLRRLHVNPAFKEKQRASLRLWRQRRPYGDYWKKGTPHPGF